MKIGLVIAQFKWPNSINTRERLIEIAQTAENVGFDSLWVFDHFYQIEPSLGKKEDPLMEAFTTLGFLAGVTKKVKLGPLVAGVIYREPALLIKAAASLDVISSGRAYFGVGAAWYEEEAVGFGFPFPSTSERFEMLEETLQIAKHIWSGKTSPFYGKHYRFEAPIPNPVPISQPHPPILVGGEGEKKTLRLVAKYADACNFFVGSGAQVLSHKLAVLKEHCDKLGRGYSSIEKTALHAVRLGVGGDAPESIINLCREMAKLGFDHLMFRVEDTYKIEPLEIFGREIIPAVKDL